MDPGTDLEGPGPVEVVLANPSKQVVRQMELANLVNFIGAPSTRPLHPMHSVCKAALLHASKLLSQREWYCVSTEDPLHKLYEFRLFIGRNNTILFLVLPRGSSRPIGDHVMSV